MINIYLQVIQVSIYLFFCLPSLKKNKKTLSTHVVTGVLERERARRLIHNYNLIYSLSLSPRRINQALQRYRSGENIILEPALQYLKEL